MEEYGRLARHVDEIRLWLQENGVNETYVDLKVASVFEGEVPPGYNWVVAIWFVGDKGIQQAVMFKLTWGGHVFKRTG